MLLTTNKNNQLVVVTRMQRVYCDVET